VAGLWSLALAGARGRNWPSVQAVCRCSRAKGALKLASQTRTEICTETCTESRALRTAVRPTGTPSPKGSHARKQKAHGCSARAPCKLQAANSAHKHTLLRAALTLWPLTLSGHQATTVSAARDAQAARINKQAGHNQHRALLSLARFWPLFFPLFFPLCSPPEHLHTTCSSACEPYSQPKLAAPLLSVCESLSLLRLARRPPLPVCCLSLSPNVHPATRRSVTLPLGRPFGELQTASCKRRAAKLAREQQSKAGKPMGKPRAKRAGKRADTKRAARR